MDHVLSSVRGRSARKGSVWARLARIFAVRRQRKALRDMDRHRLNDMGISLTEARREATKPLWDVPENWRF